MVGIKHAEHTFVQYGSLAAIFPSSDSLMMPCLNANFDSDAPIAHAEHCRHTQRWLSSGAGRECRVHSTSRKRTWLFNASVPTWYQTEGRVVRTCGVQVTESSDEPRQAACCRLSSVQPCDSNEEVLGHSACTWNTQFNSKPSMLMTVSSCCESSTSIRVKQFVAPSNTVSC